MTNTTAPVRTHRARKAERGHLHRDRHQARRLRHGKAEDHEHRHPAGRLLADRGRVGQRLHRQDLTLTITDATKDKVVYVGTFGGLVDGTKNALDRFAAGEARDYTFVVTLDGAADDTNQGKTPSTTFNWAPGAARGRSLTGDTLVTVRRPGPAAAS